MNKAMTFIAALVFSASAAAQYTTKTDQYGNSYRINKYGNTTTIQGSNPYTGSTWNQRSHTYGNTTRSNGYDSQGRYWNNTRRNNGYNTTNSGTDATGKYYSCTTNNWTGKTTCY